MKTIILSTIAVIVMAVVGCKPTTVASDTTRNLAYEAYCDSVWNADKDFYMDVLVETDEYQDYLEEHGEWWNN